MKYLIAISTIATLLLTGCKAYDAFEPSAAPAWWSQPSKPLDTRAAQVPQLPAPEYNAGDQATATAIRQSAADDGLIKWNH